MHKSIEICLALTEALGRFGFNVGTETLFAVDATNAYTRVGIVLRAQGKKDLPFIAGQMNNIAVRDIDAQWAAAATAWNLPETDPAGLSRVERQVIWEMHMPNQHLIGFISTLVERGYDLPKVPPEAIVTIKAAMQKPVQ